MTAWTKATDLGSTATPPPPTATTAGILRPERFARYVELARRPAGPGVERWIENHWSLRWDLPEGTWYPSSTLPHPTVSLTAEHGSHPRAAMPAGETVVVTGVVTRRFDVEVRGWGRVVGVRFRPGGLAALTGLPASAWTDRAVPARGVLPDDVVARLADRELAESPEAWADAAESALLALPQPDDERYELLLRVIGDMLDDHSLLTLAQVGDRHGLTVRSLQRLFTHYVGVGPKAVLARYRMHDVVTEIDEGYDGTLTDLAHRFGWYDQAHFTRDFTALVGETPSQYRDRRTR